MGENENTLDEKENSLGEIENTLDEKENSLGENENSFGVNENLSHKNENSLDEKENSPRSEFQFTKLKPRIYIPNIISPKRSMVLLRNERFIENDP
ncbi:hypothetical protein QTL97_11330 [Sporosarcina thermotolerans]|uniref:Uncharacterized protein n=1 Tax=Sporosarcina thermotolerans TaxID=633404 RepID=A0AAW9A961_9BACL|nr:hypothetical protein [Sporosarcina thermotolerans]MDW0117530.1 hypothetical protein [Sporosarcina thermotolerans]WHT49694.1 hypothetical protein QNH10_09490 [Sporosarcina thermotolerans]